MIDPLPTEPVATLWAGDVREEFREDCMRFCTEYGVDADSVAKISHQKARWPETNYLVFEVIDRDDHGLIYTMGSWPDVATHPLVRRQSGPMPEWFTEHARVNTPSSTPREVRSPS